MKDNADDRIAPRRRPELFRSPPESMATFTGSQTFGRTRSVTIKRKYEDGQPSGVKRHAQEAASISAAKGKYSHHHHHADVGKNITKKSGSRLSKFRCTICIEEKPMSDGFKNKVCGQFFCATCMSTYVASKICQNIVKVTCPTPKCSSELKPRHLRTILPREVIDRWETARCESRIAESQKTYCPFKNCSVLLVDDGGQVVTSAECPSCHRLFCAQCRVPWHAMMTCQEFQSRKYMNKNEQDLDNSFFKLAEKKKWQKCPKCKMFVQRRSGCEHIKCRCGSSFCYHCGDNWYPGHICQEALEF